MTSQPITDKILIEKMKNDLKKHNYRDYILMLMQLNAGLRIGNVIGLTVKDIKNKSYLDKVEQGTKKAKHFLLNNQLKIELNEYIFGMRDDDYLFPSRQINGDGTKNYIRKFLFIRYIHLICIYFFIKSKKYIPIYLVIHQLKQLKIKIFIT